MIAAVRVPPSACRTSQSSTIVFSPSALVSMTARRLRPTSREISWVRPPIRPLTDSRSERVLVERGSMAYSAVTQPWPVPLRQRGTPSVKRGGAQHAGVAELDEHAALGVVQPAAGDAAPARSWSGVRPSTRVAVMTGEPRGRCGSGARQGGHGTVYVAPGGGDVERAGQTSRGLGDGQPRGRSTAACGSAPAGRTPRRPAAACAGPPPVRCMPPGPRRGPPRRPSRRGSGRRLVAQRRRARAAVVSPE